MMFPEFKHVQQQTDYTCGPSCLAIITGETDIDALVAELNCRPKRGTFNKALIRALQARGIPCDSRFRSLHNHAMPHTGIIRLKHSDHKIGHVVVKQGTTWFDPEYPTSWTGMPKGEDRFWHSGWRMASALWIGESPHASLDRLIATFSRLSRGRRQPEP